MTTKRILQAFALPIPAVLGVLLWVAPVYAEGRPLVVRGSERTVTIDPAKLVDSSEGLYQHQLSVSGSRNGKIESHFSWTDHASSFESGAMLGDNLSLIGRVETAAEVLASVNLREHAERAFVLCRSPRISPDARRAAFLQFKPRQETTAPMSDAVLLLDLASPNQVSEVAHEAVQTQWVLAAQAFGVVQYPSSLAGTPYEVATGYEKLSRDFYSIEGLQWVDDDELVFVVSNGSASLKSLSLGTKPAFSKVSSTPLTPALFGGTKKDASTKLEVLDLKVVGDNSVEVYVKPDGGLTSVRAVIPLPRGGTDGD